jgi:hypothetical protein
MIEEQALTAGMVKPAQPMVRVISVKHPALGRLIRLEGAAAQPVLLTEAEAQTIALALLAVRDGRSAETEIFLSPIASDAAFEAKVMPDGIHLNGRHLCWAEAEGLAAELMRHAGRLA